MSTQPKMTAWFPPGTKPRHVGEFNASMTKDKGLKRWWNGRAWSEPYTDSTPEADKARKRSTVAFNQAHYWRGLAERPAAKAVERAEWAQSLPAGSVLGAC